MNLKSVEASLGVGLECWGIEEQNLKVTRTYVHGRWSYVVVAQLERDYAYSDGSVGRTV
jgi:hypothetical protein